MSVLIKGMEMPTACAYCDLIDSLEICPCYKMTRDEFWTNKTLQRQRHSVCPLIEVPEDVQPVVHGKNLNEEWPSLFECSICHWSCWDTYCGDTSTYNYCPNCGAKMDGGV